MNDDWAEMRKDSQMRRSNNRVAGAEILKSRKVPFKAKAEGAHLIVSKPGSNIVDYWPGTGKWICREVPRVSGRGIKKLLTYLGVKNV